VTVLSVLDIDCQMKMNLNIDSIKELRNYSFFKTLLNSKVPYFIGDKSLYEEEGTMASQQDINHLIAAILINYNASELQQEGLTNSLLMVHDEIGKIMNI